jgi:arylsulfatase A-like enzyme
MATDLPNIILVVLDTARWDRFGCYGYQRPTTPTTDTLAGTGIQVQTMISNGPWTQPAHGSLFTGLYPSQHGCQWQTGNRLSSDVRLTMAEWLRTLGYRTICATNNGLISHATGLARGFERYGFRLDIERGRRRVTRRLRKALMGGDSGGRIVNRWIRGQLGNVEEGPLFLFVNYLECHWAYAPPPMCVRAVGGSPYGYLEGLRYRAKLAARVGPWEAIARAGEDDLAAYSTLYDGELRNADRHLSELMSILERGGYVADDRSIVIVTSDHGEHIGEHGLADHHASLDDHLIRVPFVAWGPGRLPHERRSGLYEFVDVLPSLAQLLDRQLPIDVGDRRTDLFSPSPKQESDGYAFAEWRSWHANERARLERRNPSYDFSGLARDLLCVRDERFKLVRASHDQEWLFDLQTDPDEEINVMAAETAVADRLRRRLDTAIEAWGPAGEEPADLSDEERLEIEQRLSELGYI